VEIRKAKEEGTEFNPGWGPKEVVPDDKGRIFINRQK
jgi:NADPH-dependent glutamate synthase beta subunit-like oxidoreductase